MAAEALVLIVEDDTDQADLLGDFLENKGYRVATATRGEHALSLAEPPDFILLDLNLPDGDGMDFCSPLRQRFPRAFIMMLTARKEEVDRVLGLDTGADDYLTKPYSLREVAARMRALQRRRQTMAAGKEVRSRRVLWLDSTTCEACFQDQRASLTAREFRVLAWFVKHPGRIFTRDALLQACWDDDLQVTDRVVDAMVARIRRKLKQAFDSGFIFTKHGLGYGFHQPDHETESR